MQTFQENRCCSISTADVQHKIRAQLCQLVRGVLYESCASSRSSIDVLRSAGRADWFGTRAGDKVDALVL